MEKLNFNTGLWSAIICLISFIIWIFSFVGIAATSPLFKWTDLNDYINYVHSNEQFFQYLAKSFMIVFALSYLVLVVVFHEFAGKDRKILAKIAVLFGLMFAILAVMHYYVQISAVRFAFEENRVEGIEHFLQAKPTSVMSSVNMLGWTLFLGLSSLFLFFSFNANTLNKRIKTGMLLTGISCLLAGAGYLFQIDLVTFLFINLGLGGGMLVLTISTIRYFLISKTV